MRKTINPQPNLREPWLELEHARELETISSLLDAHPKLNELVLQDLKSVTPSAGSDVGRGGMSAEQVLRALLVKQLNQFSYRELAFHLADSRSYRTFCQLGIIEPTPSKSTLAANIKAVKFETLEQINRELVSVAEDAGIEKGRKVRVDCTVVESNIHPPTNSELLYDCVRVLTRLMCGARELLGTVVVFGNRTRRAKRRRLGVLNAKDKQQRRRVYRDLLKVTEETYRSAQRVAEQLEESGLTEPVNSCQLVTRRFVLYLRFTRPDLRAAMGSSPRYSMYREAQSKRLPKSRAIRAPKPLEVADRLTTRGTRRGQAGRRLSKLTLIANKRHRV